MYRLPKMSEKGKNPIENSKKVCIFGFAVLQYMRPNRNQEKRIGSEVLPKHLKD